MPFMRTSSLDFFVNSDAFNVHHYVKTLLETESFRPYELAGRLMHLHSSTAPDLRPSLLIVNFEIEMWIIFLPGSSSLITLNLALTIYKDGRFLLITNDWRRLTFFYIKTHNSCISKRCDVFFEFWHLTPTGLPWDDAANCFFQIISGV